MSAPAYHYAILNPHESVPEYPFTDVELSAVDVQALVLMAQRLGKVLGGLAALPLQPPGLQMEMRESDGRTLRLILCQLEALQHQQDFVWVGFFGQKNLDADPQIINGVDAVLLAELSDHSAILAYCTLQLPDGNYGNLVLLSSDLAREQWRESRYHQQAVADVAPNYYASVRLHNGVLRGGLMGDPDLQLVRTKYYNYHNGFWCGLRALR
jgi:hypothetical protein